MPKLARTPATERKQAPRETTVPVMQGRQATPLSRVPRLPSEKTENNYQSVVDSMGLRSASASSAAEEETAVRAPYEAAGPTNSTQQNGTRTTPVANVNSACRFNADNAERKCRDHDTPGSNDVHITATPSASIATAGDAPSAANSRYTPTSITASGKWQQVPPSYSAHNVREGAADNDN